MMPRALLALAASILTGCGLLFGPPVDCTVEPLDEDDYYFYDGGYRDVVCVAKKDLDDYWVVIQYEEWGEPYTSTYGHHDVDAGDTFHHDDAKVGAVVTVKAEGCRPRVFVVK